MSEPASAPNARYLLRDMEPVAREYYEHLADGRLMSTRCEECVITTFPPRLRCPSCGGAPGWVELPRHGRLHAFTTQESALRFPAPAVIALAEVGDIVVPGVAQAQHDSLRIGQEITVAMRPEPETGLTLLAFRPLD